MAWNKVLNGGFISGFTPSDLFWLIYNILSSFYIFALSWVTLLPQVPQAQLPSLVLHLPLDTGLEEGLLFRRNFVPIGGADFLYVRRVLK